RAGDDRDLGAALDQRALGRARQPDLGRDAGVVDQRLAAEHLDAVAANRLDPDAGAQRDAGAVDDRRAWCAGPRACPTDQLFQLTPVEMFSPQGIGSLSAGMDQACAVQLDGSLYCWGGNEVNQAGLVTPQGNAAPPTQIASGVVSVSAGQDYGCAVRIDG